MQVGAQIEPGLRPDLARGVERVAYLPGAHFAREPLQEALRHAFQHNEALGGDAALTAVDETRLRCRGGGPRQIRVLEHDERIASAQLEHRLLQVPPRLRRHLAPGAVRAGESHGAHAGIGDKSRCRLVREEHRPKQAVRKPGVSEDALDLERAARHVRRMLQDARVPGDQGRRGEAEHLPEREIPGHDGEHRPQGFEANVAPRRVRGARLVGQEGRPVLRVVVAHPGAFLRFRHPLRERLAHLDRHGARVVILALVQLAARRAQPLDALGDGAPPPVARRRVRARHDPVQLAGRRLLERLEYRPCGGVDGLEAHRFINVNRPAGAARSRGRGAEPTTQSDPGHVEVRVGQPLPARPREAASDLALPRAGVLSI